MVIYYVQNSSFSILKTSLGGVVWCLSLTCQDMPPKPIYSFKTKHSRIDSIWVTLSEVPRCLFLSPSNWIWTLILTSRPIFHAWQTRLYVSWRLKMNCYTDGFISPFEYNMSLSTNEGGRDNIFVGFRFFWKRRILKSTGFWGSGRKVSVGMYYLIFHWR